LLALSPINKRKTRLKRGFAPESGDNFKIERCKKQDNPCGVFLACGSPFPIDAAASGLEAFLRAFKGVSQ
jgi:hypothetical protein